MFLSRLKYYFVIMTYIPLVVKQCRLQQKSNQRHAKTIEEECGTQAGARRQIWNLQLPETIYKMLRLQRQTGRSREDEYVFVFRRETHVQCLSLRIHLYYIKRAAARQDNSRNKAPLISSRTFNDVMYFAIS